MAENNRKDYYEILGVACDADHEILKKAYRNLAKKYHPDRRPEDSRAEECFKDLQEAYYVLKDPVKRDRYDADVLGRKNHGGGKGRNASGAGADGKNSGVSEVVEDIFEFLRSRMEDRGKRGEDLRYMVSLNFEEAALGIEKVIRIPKWKQCSSCAGRGWKSPEDRVRARFAAEKGRSRQRSGTRSRSWNARDAVARGSWRRRPVRSARERERCRTGCSGGLRFRPEWTTAPVSR